MPTSLSIRSHPESLPLKRFESETFDVASLLAEEPLLSHAEMIKVINEYEQSLKADLVSLVNENCQDFLEVSNEVEDLTKKLVSLKDPLVLKYRSSASFSEFVKLLSTSIRNSEKLKSELVELEQSRFDVSEISEIILSLIDAEQILAESSELDPDSLSVISREMNRCHAMLSAIDSVIAETGISSATLREVVPKLRSEYSRIKTSRLLPRIEAELITNISELSSTTNSQHTEPLLQSVSILSALLDSRKSFYSLLRNHVVGEEICWKSSETFATYLDRVKSKWLSPTSILSILGDRDRDLIPNVLATGLVEELLSRTDRSRQVTLFVPTTNTLDSWYSNYTQSEDFLSSISPQSSSVTQLVLEYRSKWKIQIYVSLCMKHLLQQVTLASENPASLLEKNFSSIIPRLLRLGPQVVARILESLAELFDTLSNPTDKDSVPKYVYFEDLAKAMNRMKSVSIDSFLGEFLSNEIHIVHKKMDEIVLRSVDEIANPISQTFDSVKQVSALYRVAANRGMPIRHSVYVDLAVKPLQSFREKSTVGGNLKFTAIIESLTVEKVLKSYMKSVSELMTKERARGGQEELTKICAQIVLDLQRTSELLSPHITAEFSEYINEFMGKN